METKVYDNKSACRRYYERNKNNPEFRQRKALNTRRSEHKKRYPVFFETFQSWKSLVVKTKPMVKKVNINEKLNYFISKRNLLTLRTMMQSWKNYETVHL
jgi:hypothetical protein